MRLPGATFPTATGKITKPSKGGWYHSLHELVLKMGIKKDRKKKKKKRKSVNELAEWAVWVLTESITWPVPITFNVSLMRHRRS